MRVFIACNSSSFLNEIARNAIMSGAIIHAYANLSDEVHGQFLSIQLFVKQEVGVSMVILALGWILHKLVVAQATAVCDRKEERQSKETVQSLLSVLCDSVVHMNSDFVITGPAPKLAAMVLQTGTLHGRSFLDLIIDDDVQHVRAQFKLAQLQPHAQTLNVSFGDGSGTLLRAQLFVARVMDV